jgi:CDP-diacylglycerol pyrophosphatase
MLRPATRREDRLRCPLVRYLAAVGLAISVLVPSLPMAARAQPAACVIAGPPDSLWSLAQCCASDLHGNPSCRSYDRNGDFIILKDNSPSKPAAYLIIPATRITGIEDPRIFVPPVADLWAHGWQAAELFVQRPAVDTGLAINSEFGRTQNQLHIHISCLRHDVVQGLAENADRIGDDPAKPVAIALGPQHHVYRVIRVTSLTTRSPFAVAAAMPRARDDMAAQSIAVAGSKTPDAYFVLDTAHGRDNPGTAEELLDQSCRAS